MTEPMRRSFKMPIIVFTIFIIAVLIGYFTFLKPEPSKMLKKGIKESNKTQNITRYNVGRISDPNSWKNVRSPFRGIVGNFSTGNWSWTSEGVRWDKNGTAEIWSIRDRLLPYPRISINYSTIETDTIRGESAGNKSAFLILRLDIRNYGYKYFDAHPSKFRIDKGNVKIYPILNISTENMLDVVVPNNSRGKGDLIFLVGKRDTHIGRSSLVYMSRNYTILYNRISSEEMNMVGKDEDEEEIDDPNEDDYYVD